jgi:hypothetical protein
MVEDFSSFVIKEDLWRRFERTQVEADGDPCYKCPHATKIEKLEPRVNPKRFPGLGPSFYALVDRSTYKPAKTNAACLACFSSWISDEKYEGKICSRCGAWITKENEGMMVIEESKDEKGRTHVESKTAVCSQCLTGGKTLEEWAKGVVERMKRKGGESHE